MKNVRSSSTRSSLHLTTFLADMTGHFSIFFKKSCISFSAAIFRVSNPTFREYPIHSMCHLDPCHTINVVEPEHDSKFTLLNARYVLFHLVRKLQKLCLFLHQRSFPCLKQHHLPVVLWYWESFHNKVLRTSHTTGYRILYGSLFLESINLLF